MENGSSTPPDPLRAWLEATGGDEGGGRGPTTADPADRPPSKRLLTLTGAMTAVALALAAVALADRAPSSSGAAAAPIAVTSSPAAGGSPAATAAATTPAVHPSPATRDESGLAAAVLAVRTTSGSEAYVDTAAAEHVDHYPGFSVVTVRAWVLHRQGGHWDAGRALRYGVAVSDAAGAPALAPPWPLPPLSARPPRRQWRAVNDAGLATAAGEALRAAGYRDVTDLQVRSDPALAGVVSVDVTATDPAGQPRRRHEVWLSADGTRVLGTPAATDLPIPLEQP